MTRCSLLRCTRSASDRSGGASRLVSGRGGDAIDETWQIRVENVGNLPLDKLGLLVGAGVILPQARRRP